MRLRIITQGSSRLDRARGQWGLSVLIDDDVLFDTFADPQTLADRFRQYRIDVEGLRHIVISHDHWDHTGGLWWLLERNRECAVYVCRKTDPPLKDKIRSYGARLFEVSGPVAVKDGIHSCGELVGEYAGEPIVEQALVLENNGVPAVVTGCSHPGILAIFSRAASMFPGRIDFVLGGLHLIEAGEEELAEISSAFKNAYGVRMAAPFHCTGAAAFAYLEKHLPETIVKAEVGDEFRFNGKTLRWER